jgi:hypothetical protein
MADGKVIDLAARRAQRAQERSGTATGPCHGYSVLFSEDDGTVALVFDLDDKEATFILPRDVARRLGWRVYIASERARRGRAR